MDKITLKRLLAEKISFSFIKKDGTLRMVEAGTRSLKLIPLYKHPNRTEKKAVRNRRIKNPDLITYYDFGVNDWRSFQISQFNSLES